jgi:hypothetical protein
LEAKFADVYTMLSVDLKERFALTQLQNAYENRLNYSIDAIATVVIETTMYWPNKQASDIGWVYVAISG